MYALIDGDGGGGGGGVSNNQSIIHTMIKIK